MSKEKFKFTPNKILYPILGIILAIIFGFSFIKTDYVGILKVYITILLFGLSMFPFTFKLSSIFKEKGIFLSKSIGILVNTFIVFVLGTLHILNYSSLTIGLSILVVSLINYIFIFPKIKKEITKDIIFTFILEECIFLILLTLFSFIRGFKNEISQTEKYMDFGIMKSIYKTTYFPVDDMWMSGRYLNYYYFGQVILTTFLKLFNVEVEIGYNICLSVVIAMSTLNLATLIFNIWEKISNNLRNSIIVGSLTSIFTFFTASCHYLYYGIIKKIFFGDTSYIVYDSTRYIGYNPVTNDKTIHEFPAYGFLLGDAHAYTINTIFVIGILFLAFIYYFKNHKTKLSKYLAPEIILMGFFIGIFQMTNYWDYPIYLVTCSAILFAKNIKDTKWLKKDFFKSLLVTIPQMIEIFIISNIVSIPFMHYFRMISTEILRTKNHSLLYQLFVLWGFFAIFFIIFLVKTILERKSLNKEYLSLDTTFLFIGLCGLGLVFLPEVIYVKDIYEVGYARANTMFKLTYQAYILLSISSSYYLFRLLQSKKILKIIGCIGLIILAINTTYIGKYIKKDYGNIFDIGRYNGLDGTRYLISYARDEYKAIQYINENIEGRHIILEATGPSYETYNKISSFTGNITVYGWQTHEGLWNDYEESNEREVDIAKIYSGTDKEEAIRCLKKYNVEYIFIGPQELTAYNQDINYTLLESLGDMVFENATCKLIKLNIN